MNPTKKTHKTEPEDHKRIIQRYLEGEAGASIAKSCGLTPSTISRILRKHGVSRLRNSHRVRHDAFSHLTSESMYWIGFLFADGCVSDVPRKEGRKHDPQPRLTVALQERDRGHLEQLRQFLGSGSSIQTSTKKRYAHPGSYCTSNLAVSSSQIVADLRALGMRIGHRKASPQLVRSRDFWRGVVDGDGWVDATWKEAGMTGNMELCEQFLSYVSSLPGIGHHSITRNGSIWRVRVAGYESQVLARHLYQGASLALSRKAEAAHLLIMQDLRPKQKIRDPLAVAELYQSLGNLRAVGREFGISGTHVRRLINQYGSVDGR